MSDVLSAVLALVASVSSVLDVSLSDRRSWAEESIVCAFC